MKKYYCTFNRITDFICSALQRYKTVEALESDLKETLNALKEFPYENKNSIHFYSKVLEYLQQPK